MAAAEDHASTAAAAATDLKANVERFMGFADVYDAARPAPPTNLVDLLLRYAGRTRAACVADIGCGTGLSTWLWQGKADEVVGVEPSTDMLAQAEKRRALYPDGASNVRFVNALSTATGLPDSSVDIVTVSQALHWMDPTPTFAEAVRILRPGGLFVAYDCDWPPATGCWEAEQRYTDWLKEVKAVGRQRDLYRDVKKWEKEEHLGRMAASGLFRWVRELIVPSGQETGDARRLLQLALSQGHVATVRKAGVSDDELGIGALLDQFTQWMGTEPRPWVWGYRVRLGVSKINHK